MSENNRPVKVNVDFPKKMRVTSPELDSIERSSSRISNWLHNDLKKIMEPLMVLTKLPDLIMSFQKTVVSQTNNILETQFETNVISRQANIQVLSKKIESTQAHIKQKEEQLDKTLDSVTNRHRRLSEQLNKEQESFLRKLDSHAYEIVEKSYPKQVQERFSFDSLPTMDLLSEHAISSVTDRNICFNHGFQDAYEEVSQLLERTNELSDSLNEFDCKNLDQVLYDLPYCFVELENRKTGRKKTECMFEYELKIGRKLSELDPLRFEALKNRSTQIHTYSGTDMEWNSIQPENLSSGAKLQLVKDLQEQTA